MAIGSLWHHKSMSGRRRRQRATGHGQPMMTILNAQSMSPCRSQWRKYGHKPFLKYPPNQHITMHLINWHKPLQLSDMCTERFPAPKHNYILCQYLKFRVCRCLAKCGNFVDVQSPHFLTSDRSRPTQLKSQEEQEVEEMASRPPFHARPLKYNPSSFSVVI